MPKRKTTGNPTVATKTATNSAVLSGNSNRGNGSENGAGCSSTFKKHTSSSTLGSRADTKLSQASLSAFFSKVQPPNRPSKELPAVRTSSSHPYKPLAASVPIRTVGAKAPRRIIIDDEYDENVTTFEQQKVRGHSSYPMKRAKPENMAKGDSGTAPHHPSASSAVADDSLPFEERMPVSPPGARAPSAVLPTARIESLDRPPDIQGLEPDITTLSYTATTPQKDTYSPRSAMQPSEDRFSPFRTPTGKSRRSHSTIESLGLSPQDSVFWVRTPPSEALKKLERMNSGRSHEEEIASIVGRLYETSSAGTALRTMGRGSRDRIKDMLNTIRWSSATPFHSLEDELDDLERPDPVSPTKELLDRRRGISASRHGFPRHQSAHELVNSGRRRVRTARVTLAPATSISAELTSPTKCREDVLKMIEQINSNMTHPVEHGEAEDQDLDSGHVLLERKQNQVAFIPFEIEPDIHLQRPTALDSVPRTPLRNQSPQTWTSPGEFDQFFTDLEMDDHDLEELTQLDFLSTSMNSASSNTMSISSASTSAGTGGSSGVMFAGQERLDTNAMIKCSSEASQHVPRFGESFDASTPTMAQSMDDPPSDDFGDIGDLGDDFEIEDGTEGVEVSPPTSNDMSKYRRLRVTEVKDGVIDTRWRDQCKVLVAQDEAKDNTPFLIILRESWKSSRVTSGDIVHVISAFVHQSGTAELILDDAQGYLIVRPDSLVPTSVLAESFACIRKPIIDMRARKTGESTVPLIHGTMLHELFQQSLRSNDFSTAFMESTIDAIIKAHLNDLCLVNESIETARESLSQLISSCQDWARRYLRASPTEGVIDDTAGHAINGDSHLLCVNKILDIEENIWSPMFGLKGKIDATLQVVLRTSKKNAGSTLADSRTLTVPFELKTGKKSNVISHRAQTMLYTLLMTDRYDVDVRWGLLFYLKTGEFIRVPAPHDEIRTILMQRNEIATYEEDKLSLPPMARSGQKCGRCFSFSACTVMHKLLENGTSESSGLGNLFEEATDHLTDTHAEFLRKWNRLLSLEQGDVAKFQSQIWSMLSMDRQKAGNCFSNLLLVEELCDDDTSDQMTFGNRFMSHRYRFKIEAPLAPLSQQSLSQTLRNGHSLLSSNISVGDPIVVSSERQHYALAIGHVLDMTLSEITVGLDRPLLGPPMRLDGYDMERNQSYRGLIEIPPPALPATTGANDYHSHLLKNDVTFRVDKDEMAAGIARTRNNLIQLFRADADGGDAKRRHLVVDLERPTFDPVDSYKNCDPNLNDDQRQAVEAVLAAKDYALILGMPGTGKTTTIAHIIHTLVAQGKSVLLSSYTHSAVDNVLLKLRSDINIVRLGNRDKIHRDIRKLVPDFTKPPVNTVEAIHNFYGRCQVVGTTCLGIGDPLFTEKRFDYCIVDEASQITLPACLGPIRYADVFVLVGDHNQLPPLVKNPEARKDGFDLSLFKMLSDRYPEAVTSLTQQYRMNKDIVLLSNTLVYENRLHCATEEVARKVLEIPAMDRFRKHCHPEIAQDLSKSPSINGTMRPFLCSGESLDNPCWLEHTLDPQRSVVFVDTDDLPAHEVQVGSSTQNPTEALLVLQLAEALISGGVAEQDIGIISVLRAQLKVLSRLLRGRTLLDIQTVDRFQGKDKECVIVSLVRSNEGQHVGELLKDWRRINVAFTRAKRKLVVFGSRRTLQGSPVFDQFLQLMEQQGWILKPAPMAQHQHPSLCARSIDTKRLGDVGSVEAEIQSISVGSSSKANGGDVDAEDDKENVWIDATATAKSADVVGARKGTKVIQAKVDVVLKRNPIAKNIMDCL